MIGYMSSIVKIDREKKKHVVCDGVQMGTRPDACQVSNGSEQFTEFSLHLLAFLMFWLWCTLHQELTFKNNIFIQFSL